ncbi:Neighbor of COX4, putative [Perkinsus marinus ATCC 50983]|uniref:Neighbor of COX4, putative n=1 Tax=Perkinsus marinus (strain ATCC 50983 / TXsc) TaxID=423536 RepID=C5LGE9_PERM5|nr:Neighbor of COX4, putative [Perkinsus marinus ATCC 50983]EER04196.1 Neighbor of COX4, putative [Perkinsus marinus ATCC 50983]|eukprot:XP_002772380.1 Neighbor of COX4, putative [Perkinsus marinus ATCC 50983]
MSPTKQTFTLEAYAKPQLHAVKHQQDDVIGLLLGSSEDTIKEAVPLFHCGIVSTPMIKLALSLVETYCDKKKLKILAVYTSSAKPGPVVRQIAEVLGKYGSIIVYIMQVRSKKVTLTGYSADGLRKESPDCSVEIPEGSDDKVIEMISASRYVDVYDLDDHLHDPSRDIFDYNISGIATVALE